MPRLRLTRARELYPLTAFMRSAGIPVVSYVERHRLPARMLEMPDLFVDETRFWRLAEELENREGLPDLGCRLGRQLNLKDIEGVGALLLQQASLMQALRLFCRIFNGECLGSVFELERRERYLWLITRSRGGNGAIPTFVEVYDVFFFNRLVQGAAGRSWLPPVLELRACALPKEIGPEAISNGPIRFGCQRTAIAIPVSLLAKPMRDFRPLSHAPTVRPGAASAVGDDDFAAHLRLLMKGYLGEDLSLPILAELLYLSERTLQRRMTEAGTTFRQLQEEARFDLARHLLDNSDASLTDIGFQLGYSRSNNFSRAFRCWAGLSPRDYRFRTTH